MRKQQSLFSLHHFFTIYIENLQLVNWFKKQTWWFHILIKSHGGDSNYLHFIVLIRRKDQYFFYV